jgi:hypothetical protein
MENFNAKAEVRNSEITNAAATIVPGSQIPHQGLRKSYRSSSTHIAR